MKLGKAVKCLNCKKKILVGEIALSSRDTSTATTTSFSRHPCCAMKQHLIPVIGADGEQGYEDIEDWDSLSTEEAESVKTALMAVVQGKKPAAKRKAAAKKESKPKKAKSSSDEKSSDAPKAKKGKKKKDPNKPKAARSAYIYFTEAKRKELKVTQPEAKTTEIMKMCGELWQKCSEEDRVQYQTLATADKERNLKEMECYTPPSDDDDEEPVKKKKAKKDPNAPKKPTSSYFLFGAAVREQIKKDNPEAAKKVTEISKLIGAAWKIIEPEEKAKYEAQFKVAKDEYAIAFKAYTEKKDAEAAEAKTAETAEKAAMKDEGGNSDSDDDDDDSDDSDSDSDDE